MLWDGFQEDTSAQIQVARQTDQLRDNTTQFLMTVGSSWGKDTGGNHYAFLDAKGGWGLCAVPTSKEKILRVTEAKCTVLGSWMRLGCSGNWLSVRSGNKCK